MKACAASVSKRIMGAMYCNAIKLQWCLCCCCLCCCRRFCFFFRIHQVPSVIIMFSVIVGPQCCALYTYIHTVCVQNVQCINDLLKLYFFFARNMRTVYTIEKCFDFSVAVLAVWINVVATAVTHFVMLSVALKLQWAYRICVVLWACKIYRRIRINGEKKNPTNNKTKWAATTIKKHYMQQHGRIFNIKRMFCILCTFQFVAAAQLTVTDGSSSTLCTTEYNHFENELKF